MCYHQLALDNVTVSYYPCVIINKL